MAKPKYTFGVSAFVNSIYQNVFGKSVPEKYLLDRETYIKGIESGELEPKACLENILLSDYIKDKDLSDEEFLKLCFKVLEVKNVPEKDWEFWMSRFYTRTRKGIINGLTLTIYWEKLLDKYEVK